MNTVPFEELAVDLTKTVSEMTMMASETKSGTGNFYSYRLRNS